MSTKRKRDLMSGTSSRRRRSNLDDIADVVESRLLDSSLQRGDTIFDVFIAWDMYPTNRQLAAINRRLDQRGVRQ